MNLKKAAVFFIRNNTFPLFAFGFLLFALWSALIFMFHSAEFLPLRAINITAALYTLALCLLYKRLNRLVSFSLFALLVIAYSVALIRLTRMLCGSELYLLCAIPGVLLMTAEYKRPRWYYVVMNLLLVSAIAYTLYCRVRFTPPDLQEQERRLFFMLSQLCAVSVTFIMMIYAGFNTLVILRHLDYKSQFLKKELTYTAKHDVLTSLMNRRRTMEVFTQIEQRKAQENIDFAICIFDIDNFKRINDTYGHDAGDFVLKSYSKAIWDAFPKPNHVARWGGEEFLIIYTEVTSDAIFELERLRKRVAETPIVYNGTAITVTATFGISSSRTLATAEAVLSDADQMLLEGKSNGKNRIVVSELF